MSPTMNPVHLVRRPMVTVAGAGRRIPGLRLLGVGPRTVDYLLRSGARYRSGPIFPSLPAPRPSPRLALEVALDEFMISAMSGPRRMPSPSEYTEVGRTLAEAHELFQSQGWIDDPASYHRTPPSLTDPTVSTERVLRNRLERIEFPSLFEPRPGEPGREKWLEPLENHTASALILRHEGPPRPWLVCVHGFGTGSPLADVMCFRAQRLHQRLGLNVALPVQPMHGPRSPTRFSGERFMSHDLVQAVHGVTQSVWDLRRLRSWIDHIQPGQPVAVWGISLGGYVTSVMAGVEPDLDAVIVGIPPVHLPRLYAHHAPPHLRRQGVRDGVLGEPAHEVHTVISPLKIAPLLDRDRRFIYVALADRMSTAAQAHALWMAWDRPTVRWLHTGHVGAVLPGRVDEFVDEALATTGLIGTEAYALTDEPA